MERGNEVTHTTSLERLDAIFAAADGRRGEAGLPEPAIEEIVACCSTEGGAAKRAGAPRCPAAEAEQGSAIQSRLASWDGRRAIVEEDAWGGPVGEEMW